ncbi:MAG TPA: CAP domain-containing protein [Candidatus Dormibacteraeota bacterium]|nr:CAP domain-containing protein [Candidatus Dormibacteraeota bacterium]
MWLPSRRLGLAIGAGILIALPGAFLLNRPSANRQYVAVTLTTADGSPLDWNRLRRRPVRPPVTTPTPATPAPRAAPAPAPAPPPPRPTPPPPAPGSTQQALINQDRAQNGLPPLAWSACLANVAIQNAQRMAAQGYISHTNGPTLDLACGLGNNAGENVGYTSAGINDAQLNTMFMNSPGHRANILTPAYHYVGTAWAVAPNGYAYIAVEFS